MLRVGVTGGIGSGKSTVSRDWRELGAHVVDADAVAREVVEPGEPTLQRIRERFGDDVIRADGSLDRAALAAIVFPDRDALDAPRRHHRAGDQRARCRAAGRRSPRRCRPSTTCRSSSSAASGCTSTSAVVVEADVETRVRRLVEQRGLAEEDARHRIAAQATDEQRRAVADVVLDNSGTPDDLERAVDALWAASGSSRMPQPRERHTVPPSRPRGATSWSSHAPTGSPRAERVVARIAAALAPTGVVTEVSHIGSTSVPGLHRQGRHRRPGRGAPPRRR